MLVLRREGVEGDDHVEHVLGQRVRVVVLGRLLRRVVGGEPAHLAVEVAAPPPIVALLQDQDPGACKRGSRLIDEIDR